MILPARIALLLMVAGCGSPAPPGPSVATSPAGSPAQALTVEATIALEGLVDLAPSTDGVWYVRIDAAGGHVGLADRTGSVREVSTGPAPAAIAAGPDAIYVAEGPSATGDASRTDRIEELDPETLVVRASTPLPVATDVVLDSGTVWAVSADRGLIRATRDLSATVTTPLAGRGRARLAAGGGSVWVLNGRSDPASYLVHRIDPDNLTDVAIQLEGGGTFGAITAGADRVWVGTLGLAAGLGRIVEVQADGSARNVAVVPAAADLIEDGGRLWWISVAGGVGWLDPDSADLNGPVAVGSSGSCLAVSTGSMWACGDGLAIITPG